MNTSEYIRAHVLASRGIAPDVATHDALDVLASSEWSAQFERLMRVRMIVGALRYGKLYASGKPQWDRVQSAHERLTRYTQTGNLESLVDVANLCLLEFEEGCHPNRHFKPTDDGRHVPSK